MEKITKELIQSACDTHDFEGLMDNFFRVITGFHGGMELETWTTGGVNMIFYLQEPNKVDEFLDTVSDFNIDEEISVLRQDQRYCNDFTTAESVADFTEFKEWLENIAAIVRHIYFGNTLPEIDGEPVFLDDKLESILIQIASDLASLQNDPDESWADSIRDLNNPLGKFYDRVCASITDFESIKR